MTRPRVTIIIVNWNGVDDTLKCLSSLQEDTYVSKQIVVVDNASSDGSAQIIVSAFPDVVLIQNHANLGYTGGNNAGIRYALEHSADYVFLLNNDTILEPDALEQLVTAAERNVEAGVVVPLIYYMDQPNEAWFAGATLDIGRGIALHDNSAVPSHTDPPFEIPWATGCSMLIPAQVAAKLKGFDDRYYLYWEDVDISLRTRELGYRLILVPSAKIYHKEGGASSKIASVIEYYHIRNHLLLVASHSRATFVRFASSVILKRIRQSMKLLIKQPGSFGLYAIYNLYGITDYFRRRFGKFPSNTGLRVK